MSDGNNPDSVFLLTQDGVAAIEKGTPLTRLNYFDGKFLRADDLLKEQNYFLAVAHLSNRAGGYGIVSGLELKLEGANLRVFPGLAINADGELILLSAETPFAVEDLVKQTNSVSPSGSACFGTCGEETPSQPLSNAGADVYLITIAPAEGLCGQEDVYGKLCEAVCATDSQRPYKLEGVALRARRLQLDLPSSPPAMQRKHLRSRIASAYFALEPGQPQEMLNGGALLSEVWCPGAALIGGKEVPLGVLVREGKSNLWVDLWTARRERFEAQAKSYWQGRMRMRPWNVFLAHILQFQCQLPGAIKGIPLHGGSENGCQELAAVVAETMRSLADLKQSLEKSSETLVKRLVKVGAWKEEESDDPFSKQRKQLDDLQDRITKASAAAEAKKLQCILIEGGIVELPSAGYLPVAPDNALTVNQQVRALLGEGVDLQFCVVREDYVAHALEEAQHMDRISLTQGLDNPKNKPKLQIYVPEGKLLDDARLDNGTAWEAAMLPLSADELLLVFGGQDHLDLTHLQSGQRVFMEAAYMMKRPETPEIDQPATPARNKTDVSIGRLASAGFLKGMARTMHQTHGGGDFFFLGAVQRADGLLIARESIRDKADVDVLATANEAAKKAAENAAAKGRTARVLNAAEGKAAAEVKAANAAGIHIVGEGVQSKVVSQPTAVWLELHIDADPFDLGVGGRTGVSFELRNLYWQNNPEARSGSIMVCTVMRGQGNLRIDRVDNIQPSRPRLLMRLDIAGEISRHAPDAGEDAVVKPFSSSNVRFWLTRQGDIQTGSLSIQPIADRLAQLLWQAEWGGSPRQASFRMSQADSGTKLFMPIDSIQDNLHNGARRADDTSMELFRFNENTSVLAPDYPDRLRWLEAIGIIAETSEDSGFAEYAKRRLLGDISKSSEVGVRAKLDWVMFRRARDCDCAGAAPLPTPVKKQRYQTYHLALKDKAQCEDAVSQLKLGKLPNPKLGALQPVDVLSFTAEGASFQESQPQLVAHWEALPIGTETLFAGVWSRGSADVSQVLQRSRARALVDALADITSTRGVKIEILPGVDPKLDVSDSEGMIVLISIAKQDNTLMHRYYLAHTGYSNDDAMYNLFGNLKKEDAKQLEGLLSGRALDLGPIRYVGTTPDAADADTVVANGMQALKKRELAFGHNIVLLHAGAQDGLEGVLKTQSESIHNSIDRGSTVKTISIACPALEALGLDAISLFFPVHNN